MLLGAEALRRRQYAFGTGGAATMNAMLLQLLNRGMIRRRLAAAMVVLCLASLSGCQTLDTGRKKISNMFVSSEHSAQDRILWHNHLGPMEGQDEFDAAQKLFDEGKFAAAEKGFKKVAKKYADRPIEEQTLFMLAESQFQQKRYPKAQDSFNRLLKKYESSSRYMERSTHRLFLIAKYWLDDPQPVQKQEIHLATGGDNPSAAPTAIPRHKRPVPLIPNFTDRSRPVFDPDGRAMEALKSVWLNNPTGKLADDAVMLSGVYHLRRGDYLEAEHYFDMLRDNYPDSDHAANAYKLGAHVIQMSYQGPEYDGRGLEKARELIESTLNLYPESADRERLKEGLERINHEEARKDWHRVEYRLRRREYKAAELACVTLLQEHPDSAFADLAKEQLEKLRAARDERLEQSNPEPQFDADLPEYEEDQNGEAGEFYLNDDDDFAGEDLESAQDFERPRLIPDTLPEDE